MVVHDGDNDHPTHRIRVRADGRCAVRATLRAAGARPPPEVADAAMDGSHSARVYLRDIRRAAAEALLTKMKKDEEFDCAVRWSFPDEAFASFEEWLEAQQSDDTESATSGAPAIFFISRTHGVGISPCPR